MIETIDQDFERWYKALNASLTGDNQAQLNHLRAIHLRNSEQRDNCAADLAKAHETIRKLRADAKQSTTLLADARGRAKSAEQFSERTARTLEDAQSSLRVHLGSFEKIRTLGADVEGAIDGIDALRALIDELVRQRDLAIEQARAATAFAEQAASVLRGAETTLRSHEHALEKAKTLVPGPNEVESIRSLHLQAEIIAQKTAAAIEQTAAAETFKDRVGQVVNEAETTLRSHEHALSRARSLASGTIPDDSRGIPRTGPPAAEVASPETVETEGSV